MKTNIFWKTGVVFYVLWGLLHIIGGVMLLKELGSSVDQGLASLGTNLISIPSVGDNLVVAGLMGYYSWLILLIGLFVTILSIKFRNKNQLCAFWINLLFLAGVEVGIIWFILIPGVMMWSQGLIGISLYVIAAATSTVGYLQLTKE